MTINWKQKLSSRKFWAAVVGFVTALLTAFGVGELTNGQIAAVISAAGVLVAYIFGESFVDASRAEILTGNEIPSSSEKLSGNETTANAKPAEKPAASADQTPQ